MIIPCPHCQAKLNLPEAVQGSEVRCPTCRRAFFATREFLEGALEEGLPKRTQATPAPPPADPRDDEPYLPRVSRNIDDEDFDLRQGRADRTTLQENAKEHTRLAGIVMSATFYVTLAALITNRVLSLMEEFDGGFARNNPEFGVLQVAGIVVRLVVFSPLLVVVFFAGRNLLQLGSRSMINAGIGVNIILMLLFAVGILRDLVMLLVLPAPFSSAMLIPQIMLGGLSCGCNLGAGILATRALAQQPVREFYELQGEIARRHRY